MKKQALVVISFGSTFDDTRVKDIGGIEQALADAFPQFDTFRAFTSVVIRRRLAARGIIIDDPAAVLDKLYKAGYSTVVLQPTHLLHGEEFEQKILNLKAEYEGQFESIIISKPLITEEEDYGLTAAALITQFPDLGQNEGIVFMGHGTPRANNKAHGYTYNKMQSVFDELQAPVLIGTVEDEDSPNLATLLERLKNRGYSKVHLLPFMIVAGDHANNDMINEDDSWRSQIEKLGVETECHLNGIGRYKAIQSLYVQHMLRALS